MSLEEQAQQMFPPLPMSMDAWVEETVMRLGYPMAQRREVRNALHDAVVHGYNRGAQAGLRRADDAISETDRAEHARKIAESLPGAPVGSSVVEELASWWKYLAAEEIDGLVAKMTEYGGLSRATDLTDIGRAMVAAGVRTDGRADGSDQYLQELGCYFYVVGKMARWTAAINEGRAVSDDTLHDIGIYIRMAQRIRAAGGWPV